MPHAERECEVRVSEDLGLPGFLRDLCDLGVKGSRPFLYSMFEVQCWTFDVRFHSRAWGARGGALRQTRPTLKQWSKDETLAADR